MRQYKHFSHDFAMALQVFNWEGISSNADALAALRVVLSQSLQCLVRRTVCNITTHLGIVTTFFTSGTAGASREFLPRRKWWSSVVFYDLRCH